ncbi:MAG: DUF697 domain-containing protein [Rhodospirillaceae bacterium]|nr:DUF697 domain-containing protein [Rhodospirillaceae bacterium]MBT3492921.1 DUF697 domain-containing protein [Rhodospirillaceae bacterium]MBT3780523.1 DUF697 domain-containing protein [Rhodospirillaceae bacterium]MBT3977307.1 DUF697 domain-containing protein [Rhodospirillaceae bacterium]MBT4565731.1 DUF697 domain-containing protein [Rhodospirillaceae bacterium]
MVNKAAAETPETDASGQTATASEVNMSRKLVAENEIKDYVIASVAAGIVPVPAFDIAAVIAIQLRMIQRLSELYGKPFSDNAARNTLSALAGGVLGFGLGKMVASSAFKLIPGIGWAIGMASLPVVSGASTYAIGRSIIKHYEGGGSLFDISASDLSSYYKEQFEKGKQLAAEAKLRKAAA